MAEFDDWLSGCNPNLHSLFCVSLNFLNRMVYWLKRRRLAGRQGAILG
jgi:hypothetical protein